MWKQLYRSKFIIQPVNVRTFLSDAYKCTEAWDNRLQSPILKRIRPDLFYYDLERKYLQQGKICAVDLDILVNTVKDNTLNNELSDLVHKMRLTVDTSNTLSSTSHAVIRHHLDYSDTDLESLIYILDDRLSYGIFLDAFTANLCLDKMIKLENFRMAAKVATFLMLQEQFDNPINRALSLYSCYKYLENPESFDDLVKNQATDEDLAAEIHAAMQANDPKAKKAKKRERKEEIRVRINYIRNPYFDEHFDIRNSLHLVGKTLIAISQYLDSAIKNSTQLLGYCLFEKYSDGNKLLESLGNNTSELHKDVVEIVNKQLSQVKERDNDESFKQFSEAIKKLNESNATLKSDSFEETIFKLAVNTVKEHETKEIAEQTKIYDLWSQIRETKLKEELARVDRHDRLDKIDTLLKEMDEQEEKLWFFENETNIDLELEKISATTKVKTTKISRRQQKALDEAYIPPEVHQKRNEA